MKDSDSHWVLQIRQYCEDVLDALDVFGRDYSVFEDNIHFMNSVSMSIMQIGELAKRLSSAFVGSTKDYIPWDSIKSMRNYLSHEYAFMNKEIVWDTAINGIPELMEFCDEILSTLNDNEGDTL
ncbi:MAG: DUF86 domain-containing protein [Firmicutes bacterium]|nr:DUF86 domain-containing protein [Bacillota bacterium]